MRKTGKQGKTTSGSAGGRGSFFGGVAFDRFLFSLDKGDRRKRVVGVDKELRRPARPGDDVY